jgi:hypothetical protein
LSVAAQKGGGFGGGDLAAFEAVEDGLAVGGG